MGFKHIVNKVFQFIVLDVTGNDSAIRSNEHIGWQDGYTVSTSSLIIEILTTANLEPVITIFFYFFKSFLSIILNPYRCDIKSLGGIYLIKAVENLSVEHGFFKHG